MKLKRRYERLLTRSIPILTVEYWHSGEYHGLHEITEGRAHFNPLFIHRKDKGVDSYYDLNNPETADALLVEYFLEKPGKFKMLVRQYEAECQRLLDRSGKFETRDFSSLFSSLLLYWAKFDVINVLSGASEGDKENEILKHAYHLRKKWERVEYVGESNIMDLARKLLPGKEEASHFLTFKEISSGKIPPEKELSKRSDHYIYFEGRVCTDLSIEELEKKENLEIVRRKKKLEKEKLIKGMAAMTGKARGRAKIVFGLNQISKVKDGDILVTPMTTPEYLMAMKKAAAFVTNEGGIICHAAITAREIGKPCIIGTKIATHILRDGDLVEVDANKGVVRIIKRN